MDINIFHIISKVVTRIEPFHSELLSSFLQEDELFLKKFLKLSLPEELFNLVNVQNDLNIINEDVFSDNTRIDISIRSKNYPVVIGVEIKTNDSSVKTNQLSNYYLRMREKYVGYEIFIIYLTPFSKSNIDESLALDTVYAIKEYENSLIPSKNKTHINWDEVVDLYTKNEETINLRELYNQHREYIKTYITNKKQFSLMSKTRGLAMFLSDETVSTFWSEIENHKIQFLETSSKYLFPLNENSDKFQELLDCIEILIKSKELDKGSQKENKLTKDLLQKFENGINGLFFKNLFQMVQEYSYIWLQGKNSIGVRASHHNHKGGVSIITINSTKVTINKNR